MPFGPKILAGLWSGCRVRSSNVNTGETLNGRWDEGCLTGSVILGTFRTPEGFAVIKSELIDRISVQNPHLYRQHAEKIVNTIFSEITAAMTRGDRVELRGLALALQRSSLAAPDVSSASTPFRRRTQASARHLLERGRAGALPVQGSSSMLSSANKDCSSFLTSAQRQHRCGEGAHAVADPGERSQLG